MSDDLALYGPNYDRYGAPGDTAAQSVATAKDAAGQARVAQAWNAGGSAGPGSIAQQQAGIAYNSAFRARAMGASIPESVWSAAGAGFQRRPVPVAPWLGTWSPSQQGSGIRPVSIDLSSAERDLFSIIDGNGSVEDADIDAEFGTLMSPKPQGANAARRTLLAARINAQIEAHGPDLYVWTSAPQRGRAQASLEKAFPGHKVSVRPWGKFRSIGSSRVLIVSGGA